MVSIVSDIEILLDVVSEIVQIVKALEGSNDTSGIISVLQQLQTAQTTLSGIEPKLISIEAYLSEINGIDINNDFHVLLSKITGIFRKNKQVAVEPSVVVHEDGVKEVDQSTSCKGKCIIE